MERARNVYHVSLAGIASLRDYFGTVWERDLSDYKAVAEEYTEKTEGEKLMSSTDANASQASTIAGRKVAAMVVRKTVRVDVPQAHAFSVFTEHFGSWWPLATHKIGKQDAVTAIIEPKRGGRWFERSADGTECDWGRVQVWEPPCRLVLTWEVSADWQPDTTIHTEVEVTFVSDGPDRTTVHLEHRELEQYGEKAGMMRSIFDSEGGYGGILQRFVHAASSAELGQEVPCPSDHK